MKPRTRRPWSAEDHAEAVAMYLAGKGRVEIGEWLGRSPGSVHSRLRRFGNIPMRPQRKARGLDEAAHRAAELYRAGAPIATIVRDTGMCTAQLYRTLSTLGIPRRSRA